MLIQLAGYGLLLVVVLVASIRSISRSLVRKLVDWL